LHGEYTEFHRGFAGIVFYLLLSYKYFVQLGIKSIDKILIPRNNNMPAPGQCIILNKIPSPVKEPDNPPEMNANFFICI